MEQILMARKIKMEANGRCDYDGMIIARGKYASQVIGDPETIKAQGLYHHNGCYQMALAHYQETVKGQKMQEEARG